MRFWGSVSALLLAAIFLAAVRVSFAGTVESATLEPAEALVRAGAPHRITFNARNTRADQLQDYSLTIKLSSGLAAADLIVSPSPAQASISSRKTSIQLRWENVAPGTEMTASFNVAGGAGKHSVSATGIIYHDSAGKRYSGACNAAAVIVRNELNPPAQSKRLFSTQKMNGILLQWDQNTEADFSHYAIYRSQGGQAYQLLGTAQSNSYLDQAVAAGGSYFYRVTAVDILGNESNPSLTGETFLGLAIKSYPYSMAASASFGDLDGDGLADLIVGVPGASTGKGKNAVIGGKVDIYLGKNTTGSPDFTIGGERYDDQFGYSVAVADLDNDGYDDLVVGAPHHDPYLTWPVIGNAPDAGRVYIYQGGPTFSTTPVSVIDGEWSLTNGGRSYNMVIAEHLGFSMSLAGDLNGDGYQDIVIGGPNGGIDFSGSVTIFYGGPNIASMARQEIQGQVLDEHMGTSVSPAGDLNGDGFDDLVTGAPTDELYGVHGNAYVVYGGRSANLTKGPLNVGVTGFGSSVAGLDINSDGYGDIAVASNSSGYFFFGKENGFSPFPLKLSTAKTTFLATGDLNQDGFDELLMEGPVVYLGSSAGEMVPDLEQSGLKLIGAGHAAGAASGMLVLADTANIYVVDLEPLFRLPGIVFQSPLVNGPVYEQEFTIAGQVSAPVKQLLIDGTANTVASDGTFFAMRTLQPSENIIEVIAEGVDGKIAKRILRLSYVSLPPLLISIQSPTEGQLFHAPAVAVTGAVSDTTAQVTVNGTGSVISGNTFSADIVMQEGINTISAVCLDKYGRAATDTVRVQLQTFGRMSGRVADAQTGQGLEGVIVDVRSGDIFRAGMSGPDGGYVFSDMPSGSYTLSFARSGYLSQSHLVLLGAGQQALFDVSLERIPALDLIVLYPADMQELHDPALTVRGELSHAASVTVNGAPAEVNATSFSAQVRLVEGQNPITVIAHDQYNQTAAKDLTVLLTTRGDLGGIVADSNTGSLIEGASVVITDAQGARHISLTNAAGSYSFSGLPAGLLQATITKAGYHAGGFEETILAGKALIRTDRLLPILPVLSAITVTGLLPDSVTIMWETDVPADSTVEYGLTAAYGLTAEDAGFVTSHNVSLQGISAGETYHYRVVSRSEYGFTAYSGDMTFTVPFFAAAWLGCANDQLMIPTN